MTKESYAYLGTCTYHDTLYLSYDTYPTPYTILPCPVLCTITVLLPRTATLIEATVAGLIIRNGVQ
jgi:hypothetical protein